MSIKLIQALIPHLPRYAEENGDFYSVKRTELIQVLTNEKCSVEVAENTLAMLENLLDTLATLDPAYLEKGEWCFISFPAQLMALSVLTAMSDSNSRFFETNFWNTRDTSHDKKDQQREVLKQIENHREKFHLKQKAQPIRYIYVAWSLIKYEGEILFYQREDTKKRHDKNAGDYGLVGGRLNQQDMNLFSGDLTYKLQALQSPNTELIKPELEETLKRELREEIGLIHEQHYDFKLWRELKPYQQVQGSAPNHALTEYFINLYEIELTLEGFCFLQRKEKEDERIVWFTLDDIENGKTADGKIAYINALYDDFDGSPAELKESLGALKNSFSANYYFNKEKYGITLPQKAAQPIVAGVLGKESKLEIELSAKQLKILLGLAAHLREFKFSKLDPDIELHPYGWVKVRENTQLQTDLIELSGYLSNQKIIVLESQNDCYFRVSVVPTIIYFDDAYFSFSINQSDLDGSANKIPYLIQREVIGTTLGHTEVVKITENRSLELASDLQKMIQTEYSADNEFASKTKDNYRKALQPSFHKLGHRGLIRQEGSRYKVCCTAKFP